MSLTFPPMNNQATILTTTANGNVFVTLTSPTTITTTAIASASGMVNINLAPTISVAAKGQEANFETRLHAMENAIFKLGVHWKSSFQQKILRVGHEKKMIEDI